MLIGAAAHAYVILLMKTINDFAKIADQFCSWTESLQKSDEVNLDDLLIMLSSLLNKALLMPPPYPLSQRNHGKAGFTPKSFPGS